MLVLLRSGIMEEDESVSNPVVALEAGIGMETRVLDMMEEVSTGEVTSDVPVLGGTKDRVSCPELVFLTPLTVVLLARCVASVCGGASEVASISTVVSLSCGDEWAPGSKLEPNVSVVFARAEVQSEAAKGEEEPLPGIVGESGDGEDGLGTYSRVEESV